MCPIYDGEEEEHEEECLTPPFVPVSSHVANLEYRALFRGWDSHNSAGTAANTNINSYSNMSAAADSNIGCCKGFFPTAADSNAEETFNVFWQVENNLPLQTLEPRPEP